MDLKRIILLTQNQHIKQPHKFDITTARNLFRTANFVQNSTTKKPCLAPVPDKKERYLGNETPSLTSSSSDELSRDPSRDPAVGVGDWRMTSHLACLRWPLERRVVSSPPVDDLLRDVLSLGMTLCVGTTLTSSTVDLPHCETTTEIIFQYFIIFTRYHWQHI